MTPTREQLASIEWAGMQSVCDDDPSFVSACPECCGIYPPAADGAKWMNEVHVGHHDSCWLAACLAAPPPQVITDCKVFPDESGLEPFLAPEPQAMPPIEPGDWVLTTGFPGGMAAAILAGRGLPVGRLQSYADAGDVLEIRKANGTVWTREPRR